MITWQNVEWISLVLLVLAAPLGVVAYWGRERPPTDWTAPATDAHEINDYTGDVPPVIWSDAIPPGGYVCAAPVDDLPHGVCGWPIEHDPCPAHGTLVRGEA